MTLKKTCYLIVGGKRAKWSRKIDELTQPRIVSAKTGKPKTQGNEVAIKLTIELPDALFEEPEFTAAIKVDESNVSRPTIDAEVIDNIEQVVSEATGLTLKIESGADDEE